MDVLKLSPTGNPHIPVPPAALQAPAAAAEPPSDYWLARDHDGSVHAFFRKPCGLYVGKDAVSQVGDDVDANYFLELPSGSVTEEDLPRGQRRQFMIVLSDSPAEPL